MGDLGVLLIGDGLFGPAVPEDWLDDLSKRGVRAEAFSWTEDSGLHAALQRAYQHIRRDGAVSGALAVGAGCDCALALAGQLPMDRLVLLEPLDWQASGGGAKALKRVRGYAWRGAAFCVADALLLAGPATTDELVVRWRRALCNSRFTALRPSVDLWTNRKEVLKLGVFRFLCDGTPPKSLAENPEMCII